MIKKFYVFAWFLLIGSALASIFAGTFDAVAMVAVSLGVFGLVYALALWAVSVNTGDVQPQSDISGCEMKFQEGRQQ